MVSLMRNLTISCPFCDVENKLTVFQAEKTTMFRVKCNACAREFQIDSTGNIADMKTSTDFQVRTGPPEARLVRKTVEPPEARMSRKIIEPPEARLVREHRIEDKKRKGPEERESGEVEDLLNELDRAEEEDSIHEKRARMNSDRSLAGRKMERTEIPSMKGKVRKGTIMGRGNRPGQRIGNEPAMGNKPIREIGKEPEKGKKPVTGEGKKPIMGRGREPIPEIGQKPLPGIGQEPDDRFEKVRSEHPYIPPGHRYPPEHHHPIPPEERDGPPGYSGRPSHMKQPNYPHHSNRAQYPYPFKYGSPPFSKNPEWVWKLLLISAVLGLFTSIILFLIFNLSFNGELDKMTLDGTVVDEKGDPISNATLTILDENLTGTTNARGRYEIENISTGTHTLQVFANGHSILYYRFTIATWSVYDEDFILKNASKDPQDVHVDDSMGDEMYVLPTFMIICSTIAFLGGITARKRKYWAFCVIASIAGFFSFGMVFISPPLSIAAMVILFRTRDAYHRK